MNFECTRKNPQLIAITNRSLCSHTAQTLPERITHLCQAGFSYIIVREKDLSRDEYVALLDDIARWVSPAFWPRIILHSYSPAELSKSTLTQRNSLLVSFLSCVAGFHLTAHQLVSTLAETPDKENHTNAASSLSFDASRTTVSVRDTSLTNTSMIGASVHSHEEALRAASIPTRYVIASHMYSTACKPNLEPRGPQLLSEISSCINPSTTLLWALGGITPYNASALIGRGAQGLCLMSSAMTQDPYQLARAYRQALTADTVL